MTAGATLESVRSGGKAALARALTGLEASPEDETLCALLDEAVAAPIGQAIGLTGPPGVGKSTLTSQIIASFRSRQISVGVIAIDPSSRRTGGALLGDRTRLEIDPDDSCVFIRSMAARDRLGGLADQVAPAVWLMRALFDRVIIETVGVGQSETDIRDVADTVILAVQPASGDSLQYMKAGIVEIPDIAVVTKADLGEVAQRTRRELQMALAIHRQKQHRIPVLAVSATRCEGIGELIDAATAHFRQLERDGSLASRRGDQAMRWLQMHVREQYGRTGMARAADLLQQASLDRSGSPARWAGRIRDALGRG